MKKIAKILKDDGIFLFSIAHPMKFGSFLKKTKRVDACLLGYRKYNQKRCEVFGDYLHERKIYDKWFDEFEVNFFHRPFSKIFGDILKSDFYIIDFIEPAPIKSDIKGSEIFFQIYSKIPMFAIFELKKKKFL